VITTKRARILLRADEIEELAMKAISRFILISSLLLNGCTAQISPVLERRPLVQPLPLTVGVYFSPEFRTYQGKKTCTFTCVGPGSFDYDLGPHSVAMFELVLAGMFDSIVAIETLSPPSSPGIAGIIAPKITDFNATGFDEGGFLLVLASDITYQVTLYSPAGVEMGTWQVVGNGGIKGREGFIFGHGDREGESVRRAMRDAATTFIKGFRQEPVVKRWLEDANIASKETLSDTGQPDDRKGGKP
jgi:hypothetical protein